MDEEKGPGGQAKEGAALMGVSADFDTPRGDNPPRWFLPLVIGIVFMVFGIPWLYGLWSIVLALLGVN